MDTTTMTTDNNKHRNPLPWILIGAVLAALIMILLSWWLQDSSLRTMAVMLFVPLTGAIAGWGIYAINPFGKPRGLKKSIWLLVAVLVYVMAVIFGYTLAEVGSM